MCSYIESVPMNQMLFKEFIFVALRVICVKLSQKGRALSDNCTRKNTYVKLF